MAASLLLIGPSSLGFSLAGCVGRGGVSVLKEVVEEEEGFVRICGIQTSSTQCERNHLI